MGSDIPACIDLWRFLDCKQKIQYSTKLKYISFFTFFIVSFHVNHHRNRFVATQLLNPEHNHLSMHYVMENALYAVHHQQQRCHIESKHNLSSFLHISFYHGLDAILL